MLPPCNPVGGGVVLDAGVGQVDGVGHGRLAQGKLSHDF